MLKFRGFDCEVIRERYEFNLQPALILRALPTKNNLDKFAMPGETICKATSCIDYPFLINHTAIKNYSENKGILTVLMENNIVRPTGLHAQLNFVEFPIVEILDESIWGKQILLKDIL